MVAVALEDMEEGGDDGGDAVLERDGGRRAARAIARNEFQV